MTGPKLCAPQTYGFRLKDEVALETAWSLLPELKRDITWLSEPFDERLTCDAEPNFIEKPILRSVQIYRRDVNPE